MYDIQKPVILSSGLGRLGSHQTLTAVSLVASFNLPLRGVSSCTLGCPLKNPTYFGGSGAYNDDAQDSSSVGARIYLGAVVCRSFISPIDSATNSLFFCHFDFWTLYLCISVFVFFRRHFTIVFLFLICLLYRFPSLWLHQTVSVCLFYVRSRYFRK